MTTQVARNARYLARRKADGDSRVIIAMTAAELSALDSLRLPGESRVACVNRIVTILCHPRMANIRMLRV